MQTDETDPIATSDAAQTRAVPAVRWQDAPTQTLEAGGVRFAYRRLGPSTGTPVVLLTHLAAVLDNWDPRIVDGLAAERPVIAFDNRGVGATTGTTPTSIDAMARDAVAFIRGLGLEEVDLLGFSLGGMLAQVIAAQEPRLVRRLILAGTGPAGGAGIEKVARLSYLDTARGLLTFQDPKQYLFFTRTPGGIAAGKAFVERLKERTEDRDTAISVRAFRAQLKAIGAWARATPADLAQIRQPVLVANGEHDRMVPTENSYDLHRRLPNSELVIYPDAGHGGIFQFHEDFVARTLAFL